MDLRSVEVFDGVQNRHYSVLLPADELQVIKLQSDDPEEIEDDEAVSIQVDNPTDLGENQRTWSQNETLALINIFSLHKDKFKHFKMKKDRWKLISKELAKIGIDKLPIKCEIKWRNLLRSYRSYKATDRAQGKFEFYNEIDDIVSNDPQFRNMFDNFQTPDKGLPKPSESRQTLQHDINATELLSKKRKCTTCKSEKQQRHEDRMSLLRKKLEIEERKVTAFEDYLRFLKSNRSNL
ncbi:uncharacterized protein [Diabrotica undecimpunctata]|uniref:uncharacterized protein n=1 Tax=Diabrotica undecimpunctata TaxID=50387 RepID=UPI003B640252